MKTTLALLCGFNLGVAACLALTDAPGPALAVLAATAGATGLALSLPRKK